MRPWIAVMAAVVLPVLLGCRVDHGVKSDHVRANAVTQDQPSAETYAIGTAVTPSGAVAAKSAGDNFIRGGEVFLSVDVSGASSDQSVVVRWVDPAGRVIRSDTRLAPQGAHYLPFSSGQTSSWQPGPHRAVIVIDGRRVSEKAFDVL